MPAKRNTQKKILMTADTLGGVWTYVVDLCTYLESRNIEVILATMGAYLNKFQLAEISELQNITLYESNYKLEWMNDPWSDVNESIKWLIDIKEKHNPDLIHLNTFAHGVINSKAPILTVAHSDVLSWWKAVKNEEAPEQWREYYRYVYKGLSNSDMVVAPGRHMLNMISENYGVMKNPQVIYNGRNQSLFAPKEKEKKILSAGRLWDEGKNIQLLIKASKNIKWQVCLAGEEHHPCGQDFDTTNINFLGKLSRERLAEHLSSTSIYVLPAKYEPFGLSVLEAALSRCALVIGNIKSLREIWQDNAVYVNTDKPEELSHKVNELINNPKLLEQYSNKAYKHASKFSHENMGKQYVECYKKLSLIKSNKQSNYEHRNVLSFTPIGLESRKRSFSPGNSNRVNLQRRNSKSL